MEKKDEATLKTFRAFSFFQHPNACAKFLKFHVEQKNFAKFFSILEITDYWAPIACNKSVISETNSPKNPFFKLETLKREMKAIVILNFALDYGKTVKIRPILWHFRTNKCPSEGRKIYFWIVIYHWKTV